MYILIVPTYLFETSNYMYPFLSGVTVLFEDLEIFITPRKKPCWIFYVRDTNLLKGEQIINAIFFTSFKLRNLIGVSLNDIACHYLK